MNSAIQPRPINSVSSRLAAIILAAGYSSRMGDFKPLLPIGGATALERCIGLFFAAGVEEVIAVLGHRADQLQPLAERCGARCVVNPQFDRGMYSSIVVGCRALPRWVEAAFVLPADIPLVRLATVRQLADTRASSRAGILYPVFNGHRGHPPLIDRSIFEEAAAEGVKGPLSTLLANHESDAIEVRIADQAIHMDMDTQADYKALLSLDTHRDIPNSAECEQVLAAHHVESRIVRHSRKVAEIAGCIATALQCNGRVLNLDLVQAAALLHDIAKGQSNHAAVGASILRSLGFDVVAEVVAEHTDLSTFSGLDEMAIVYLADKLVRGEEVVTIKERFKPALMRFTKNPTALEGARKRMRKAKKVARAVELHVGRSLQTIIGAELILEDRPATPKAQEVGAR